MKRGPSREATHPSEERPFTNRAHTCPTSERSQPAVRQVRGRKRADLGRVTDRGALRGDQPCRQHFGTDIAPALASCRDRRHHCSWQDDLRRQTGRGRAGARATVRSSFNGRFSPTQCGALQPGTRLRRGLLRERLRLRCASFGAPPPPWADGQRFLSLRGLRPCYRPADRCSNTEFRSRSDRHRRRQFPPTTRARQRMGRRRVPTRELCVCSCSRRGTRCAPARLDQRCTSPLRHPLRPRPAPLSLRGRP